MNVTVPDIGDFTDVPVVEVLVSVGDEVAENDPLVVLESDKASLEIPAPQAGTVTELKVSVGDTVSEGSAIAVLNGSAPETAAPEPKVEEPAAEAPVEKGDVHAQVLVIGSGPGGYSAAFRAADLGLEVVMVERYQTLGGVCLNVGCIPSKALLHVAKVIEESERMTEHGVKFAQPEVEVDELRGWKESVVGKLTGGLEGMAKMRKVQVVHGNAQFTGPNTITVTPDEGDATTVSFDNAIVAAGSRSVKLPGIPHDDPRVMSSTGALEIADIPERLLVVGGGIIGLEMATVYDALGSKVTVVELLEGLMPGTDRDLVKPLQKRIEKRYAGIHTSTKVESIEAKDDGLHAKFSGDVEDAVFDRVLVSVGREPNGADLSLDKAGVTVDERGFVPVDAKQRTNVAHIYAIGDVVGQPMLEHKATAEGHVAAEVIAGHDVVFDPRGIPNVAYTDPEVAWVGPTEAELKEQGVEYERQAFPWAANGRALSVDASDGSTKLLYDPETKRILGGGIVGPSAGDLISEVTLALEMGADVGDVGLTIHPHPTLSETVRMAAEMADGTVTDLPNPAVRRKRR